MLPVETLEGQVKLVHPWSPLNTHMLLFTRLSNEKERAIHYLILLPFQDCSLQYILQCFVQAGFKTSK